MGALAPDCSHLWVGGSCLSFWVLHVSQPPAQLIIAGSFLKGAPVKLFSETVRTSFIF